MHSGPIHQRTITINTFETDQDTLVIDGTLVDDRLCKTFIYLLSTFVDPKIVHHMSLKLELSLPTLTIKSAKMDMHEVPHEVCRNIYGIDDKLVGISIFKGFNKQVNQLMSGKNGCLHLFNLLLSMRAAAFQGLFTYLSRVQEDGSIRLRHIDESVLINTCHVWSESGPFVEKIEAMRTASRARRAKKVTPVD